LTPIVLEFSDTWVGFLQVLTDVEVGALRIIADEAADTKKIKTFADSKGLMLEVLADSINEKAMDTIGDNILEFSDTMEIYDEYKSELKSALKSRRPLCPSQTYPHSKQPPL
jgi:hypothetical protein